MSLDDAVVEDHIVLVLYYSSAEGPQRRSRLGWLDLAQPQHVVVMSALWKAQPWVR